MLLRDFGAYTIFFAETTSLDPSDEFVSARLLSNAPRSTNDCVANVSADRGERSRRVWRDFNALNMPFTESTRIVSVAFEDRKVPRLRNVRAELAPRLCGDSIRNKLTNGCAPSVLSVSLKVAQSDKPSAPRYAFTNSERSTIAYASSERSADDGTRVWSAFFPTNVTARDVEWR
jgi:hypothetical protein